MSDPNNPYDQQPAQPAQPSYPTQPPPPAYPPAYQGAYGAQPAQPAQPNAYGYSTPAYAAAPVSDKRPGRVTAAAVIAIVSSVIGLLLGAFGAVGVATSRSDIIQRLNDRAVDDDNFRRDLDQVHADTVVNILIIAAIVFAIWCLIAVFLGIGVLRRSKVSRILLTISAAVSGLISLLGILSIVSVVPLIASIVCIVLMFGGTSNDWFARRAATP